MKRFLALMLVCATVFGLLAGCNSKPAPTEPGLNNIEAGKFILTANASITLTYNTDGIIVDVKENNRNGELLANHEENYLGKSCLDAAAQFIANAVEYKFITAETRNIISRDVMVALGKDGIIINVGRGALIDEPELVR